MLDALRAARDARSLSQASLGQRLGMSQAQISLIERGLSDPRLSTIQNIAGALDLQLVLVPRSVAPAVQALVEAAAGRREGGQPLYRLRAEAGDDRD
jgi:transcriptional regulator with XRE-family HTH domain